MLGGLSVAQKQQMVLSTSLCTLVRACEWDLTNEISQTRRDLHYLPLIIAQPTIVNNANCNNIITKLLKFAGYIYDYKILSGNICGLILKNKMATTGVSFSVMKQCVEIFPLSPLEQKDIIGGVLKFSGYIHYYKILPGNIFGLILKNKLVTMGISLMVTKEFYTFLSFFSSMASWMSSWLIFWNSFIYPQYILQIFDLEACLIFNKIWPPQTVFFGSQEGLLHILRP